MSKSRSYLLRLPEPVREKAVLHAKADGISLNQFISLAVTEKLARLSPLRSEVSMHPKG